MLMSCTPLPVFIHASSLVASLAIARGARPLIGRLSCISGRPRRLLPCFLGSSSDGAIRLVACLCNQRCLQLNYGWYIFDIMHKENTHFLERRNDVSNEWSLRGTTLALLRFLSPANILCSVTCTMVTHYIITFETATPKFWKYPN